jgi:EmrB/QacA subfamily drug resistance transporter
LEYDIQYDFCPAAVGSGSHVDHEGARVPQTSDHPSRSGLLLGVLVLAGGGYSLVQSLVVPALPTLQLKLHTTPTGATWVFTAFLLSSAVATPLAGRLGDMFGRRRIFLATLIGLSLGILVAALTASLAVMIVARTVQGLGGAIFPLAFGIIRDELDGGDVARGTAWMSAVLGGGGVLGIVLAGPILQHLSYHWLFWVPLVVAVASLVAAFLVVPDRPGQRSGGVSWPAALLLAGWLVCLLVAVSEGPAWGWRSGRVIVLFASSVLLLLAWINTEERSRVPLVDLRMLRIRGVWTTNAAAILVGWGTYSAFVLIPEHVEAPTRMGGFGASVATAGLYLVPWSGALTIASSLSGRLSSRFGSRVPLIIGTALGTAGFAWLIAQHDHPWQIIVASTLLGAGTGFAFASMINLVIENVPPEQTGVATGMHILMRTLGGAVGTQVAASVLSSTVSDDGLPTQHGFAIAFVIGTVALAASTLAALAAPGDSRRPSPMIPLASYSRKAP